MLGKIKAFGGKKLSILSEIAQYSSCRSRKSDSIGDTGLNSAISSYRGPAEVSTLFLSFIFSTLNTLSIR